MRKTASNATFQRIPAPIPGARAYRFGECAVLVGVEAGRWHLSISHPYRYPEWNEIKRARYELCPHNITMAMLLPPPAQYINIHENCFHLLEVQDELFPAENAPERVSFRP